MRKVLAIASQKGGVGKTTTAVNLSACLSLSGHACLLVDLDPQANATSGLGRERGSTSLIDDALLGSKSVESLIEETGYENLALLPASRDLLETSSLATVGDDILVKFNNTIMELNKQYQCIIFDCPPSLGILPRLALAASTGVLIPVQCEYYAMEGLSQILPEVRRMRATLNPRLDVEGLLLTMYDEGLELSREVSSEVRSHFPERVYDTLIPRDVALAEASSYGKAIFEYDVSSRGAWAYARLAKEVSEDVDEKAGAGAGSPDRTGARGGDGD